jgi:cysteine synthase A
MRFLGAKVVLTPAAQKGTGMVAKAEELAKKHGWWQSKQFENPANAEMHVKTTAREIMNDFSDVSLDYWVSGMGTGGTVNGVSRVLKDESPNTKIIVCEPENAALVASGIAQPHATDGSCTTHPAFHPHPMQGWTPDFIPKLVDEVVDALNFDELKSVKAEDAMKCSRDLAQKEGIFVGISAGATLACGLEIARTAAKGSNILCMLPDTGERYLSTPLFADISTGMTDAEVEISRSTPGYQFEEDAVPV